MLVALTVPQSTSIVICDPVHRRMRVGLRAGWELCRRRGSCSPHSLRSTPTSEQHRSQMDKLPAVYLRVLSVALVVTGRRTYIWIDGPLIRGPRRTNPSTSLTGISRPGSIPSAQDQPRTFGRYQNCRSRNRNRNEVRFRRQGGRDTGASWKTYLRRRG